MQIFLWVLLVLLALDALCGILMLAKDDLLPRTPAGVAFNAAANAALAAWAAVLLFGR